jgi:hypothetical protein
LGVQRAGSGRDDVLSAATAQVGDLGARDVEADDVVPDGVEGAVARHRDHGGFLQRQDVGEVVGELLQEGLLGRTRVAEDGRQPEGPEQVVGHAPDRR